jgi:hypothetical protein
MSWRLQKVFTLVLVAAALVISALPVGGPRDLVAQKIERASP